MSDIIKWFQASVMQNEKMLVLIIIQFPIMIFLGA